MLAPPLLPLQGPFAAGSEPFALEPEMEGSAGGGGGPLPGEGEEGGEGLPSLSSVDAEQEEQEDPPPHRVRGPPEWQPVLANNDQ